MNSNPNISTIESAYFYFFKVYSDFEADCETYFKNLLYDAADIQMLHGIIIAHAATYREFRISEGLFPFLRLQTDINLNMRKEELFKYKEISLPIWIRAVKQICNLQIEVRISESEHLFENLLTYIHRIVKFRNSIAHNNSQAIDFSKPEFSFEIRLNDLDGYYKSIDKELYMNETLYRLLVSAIYFIEVTSREHIAHAVEKKWESV